MSKPVRTRIAPSPTGDPHVGTGYMGLVNLVHARQHGGQFILRIDDTDRSRFRAGSEQAVFDALRWLGLEWDEGPDKGGPKGPYRQSERTEIYREHSQILLDRGTAYRCFCTTERLNEVRAAQRERKETTRYDGHCRELDPAEVETRLAAGEANVVRLKVPLEGETVVEDLLRDPIVIGNKELQDQVLMKQDGFPTYHLASVVDDHLMEISTIIRAEEWISSAPLHKILFDAFGWEMPEICHMPLLRNNDKNKTKISKRKNPTSILYYEEVGYLPQGMLNFLGLMGWGGPKTDDGGQQEIFTVDDMLEHFKLARISLGSPVFDVEKLNYINAHHQRQLDGKEYAERVREFLFDDAKLEAVCALVQHRTETLGEFMGMADFFFGNVSHVSPETRKKKQPQDRLPAEGLVPKGREAQDTWFALRIVQETLDAVEDWTAAVLEPQCRPLASEESTGWKVRDLFMSLRVAMTGKTETPPLFESMEVLGKARCMGRLTDAMRVLGTPGKKAMKRWEKERKANKDAK